MTNFESNVSETTKEVTKSIIDHQKSQNKNVVSPFLDDLTMEILSNGVFRKQDMTRDSGLYAILYPREYGEHVRDTERRANKPYMQQIEFLIESSGNESLIFEFHFLQPKLKILQRSEGNNYYAVNELRVGEITYNKTVEDTVQRTISTKVSIDEIATPKIDNFEFGSNQEYTEDIHDAKGQLKGRYVGRTPTVTGYTRIHAVKLNDRLYRINYRVTNTSAAKSQSASKFTEEFVSNKCFYGTFIKTVSENASIISPLEASSEISTELKNELLRCANINTSLSPSTADKKTLFASPIILHDYPRDEPLSMDLTLAELCVDQETLLRNLTLLKADEKNDLVKSGRSELLLKVVRSLANTSPTKIVKLYQFQWDAIQHFIKKLFANDKSPLMIRAPTDSGKSIIFYVCTAIKRLFNKDAHGTVAFIMFPTRALNTQQFSEMVNFFYQLNKEGMHLTIGLYMGTDWGDKDLALHAYWPPDVKAGQEVTDIERCPKCGSENIVANKPDERRIIPKCSSCSEELDYIFLSNMETEEYCPTVVVGTPDKVMYSLTANPWSHTIFGAPCKKCSNCGRYQLLMWSNQEDKNHNCRYCSTSLGPEAVTSSTPSLIVFDEVHTLSGTQGNLLGQFLSLMKVTNKRYGLDPDYWYLGATATIANQEELVKNLTGQLPGLQFPPNDEFTRYFEKRSDQIRHRYLVVEPLARTTRWSVSNLSLDTYSILKQLKSNPLITKDLKSHGFDVPSAYKVQTIYVLRKTDGRILEKYIPNLASRQGGEIPLTQFGSGDLPRNELVELNKRVKQLDLDVLIVTQIYGQGVDFPGLNIMHFFGIPRSFIEMAQVVGRTGRRDLPGIVILHLQPDIPRDQWVYSHFKQSIGALQVLFEPMPINVLNSHAISLSLPNVLNALLISRMAHDYKMRFADYCGKHFQDVNQLKSLLDECLEVYLKTWNIDSGEEKRIRSTIFLRVTDILRDFRNSKYDTTKALKNMHMLLTSLRDPSKQVPYTESIKHPILDKLQYKETGEEDETLKVTA